jgi:pyruvate/2-oxoglutarate dehydrogenase complex dihydrolipoamide acyltransferase (E2) component
MRHDVLLPKAGMSMTEGTILEFTVEDGASVEEGQPLYMFETDKTEMVVDAPQSGTVHHAATVGQTLEVGDLVCSIETAT